MASGAGTGVGASSRPSGRIVYSLVSRGKTVLAEYTATSGNFPTITRVLLSKIPVQDGKMSYVYDAHVFHYIVEDEMTYLCLADEEFKRRIPFLFLEDIKEKFKAAFSDEERQNAIAFTMNDDFSRVLRKQMEYFNENPNADKLTRVRNQIDDVKGVMVENIEKVLQRGEKIELLVDKTDRMQQAAFKFEKSAKKLKREMWWKNAKTMMMMIAIILLVIFFVSATACGGLDFHSC
mmetsp:Transcript_2915/g.3338  ORF Transcript_2915/g.3338 Transcript_2915/m.3338 type:complete len:235 (-) Transcript_2915:95-799(-)